MSLKKVINSIGHFIGDLWRGLRPVFKRAVHTAVNVVDAIKKYDEANPDTADILTALIPGDLDNKIKNKLRNALPRIVVEMRLVDATLNLTDPSEIMKAAVTALQQIEGDWLSQGAKKNFYDSLAVLIAQVASDGKLDWDDAKYILKYYYDNKSKLEKAV